MGIVINYEERLLSLSLLGDNMTDAQVKQAKKLVEWMKVHKKLEDKWSLE